MLKIKQSNEPSNLHHRQSYAKPHETHRSSGSSCLYRAYTSNSLRTTVIASETLSRRCAIKTSWLRTTQCDFWPRSLSQNLQVKAPTWLRTPEIAVVKYHGTYSCLKWHHYWVGTLLMRRKLSWFKIQNLMLKPKAKNSWTQPSCKPLSQLGSTLTIWNRWTKSASTPLTLQTTKSQGHRTLSPQK